MFIYTMHDLLSGLYEKPSFCNHASEILAQGKRMVIQDNLDTKEHAQVLKDYELVIVGEFDEVNGAINAYKPASDVASTEYYSDSHFVKFNLYDLWLGLHPEYSEIAGDDDGE